MSMKPCRECKKEISSEAKTCPNCGVKKPHRRKIGVGGGIILAVAALLILGALISEPEPEPESAEGRAARLEREAVEAAAKKRWGKHCLSIWDGSHMELVMDVKRKMRDPDSFEHIVTKMSPVSEEGTHTLEMDFRARNKYGGMDIGAVTALVQN